MIDAEMEAEECEDWVQSLRLELISEFAVNASVRNSWVSHSTTVSVLRRPSSIG
jgi:hypothetical protein